MATKRPTLYEDYEPVIVHNFGDKLEAVFQNLATRKLEIWKRVPQKTKRSIRYRSWYFELDHLASVEELAERGIIFDANGLYAFSG